MSFTLNNKQYKSLRSYSIAIKNEYNLSLLEYYIKFKNFVIPKCIICNEEAKIKGGLTFRKTCGSTKCKNDVRKLIKLSEETKGKIRKARIKYMLENPEQTAWRTKNMSYPEEKFLNKLISEGLDKQHLIVREYSVFPFYIDFAFINEKIAIEIDGSQHELPDIKIRDAKKDKLLNNQGWRILRIPAKNVLFNIDETLKQTAIFLSSDVKFDKIGLFTAKKFKEVNKDNSIKEEKIKLNEALSKKVLESNIDFTTYGWSGEVAKITSIRHQKVSKWMRKWMPDVYDKAKKRVGTKY
jgi:very-short-patch-repair endonuclease